MTDDFESRYAQLRALAAQPINLGIRGEIDSETQMWLARADALIEQMGNTLELMNYRVAVNNLVGPLRQANTQMIMATVYRALAIAEQKAPQGARGAFIGVGNGFQFFAEMARILKVASKDVLILDPYLDATALTDLAVLVPDGIPVRLLADREHLQPNLLPAVERWHEEHRNRPLSCRVSKRKSLHDRLAVVDGAAWDLSQSIKNFSNRSPGSITKCGADLGLEKIAYYEEVWSSEDSKPLG